MHVFPQGFPVRQTRQHDCPTGGLVGVPVPGVVVSGGCWGDAGSEQPTADVADASASNATTTSHLSLW